MQQRGPFSWNSKDEHRYPRQGILGIARAASWLQHGLRSRLTWVQVLTLLLPNCEALSNSLNLSVPWFSHRESGDDDNTSFTGLL